MISPPPHCIGPLVSKDLLLWAVFSRYCECWCWVMSQLENSTDYAASVRYITGGSAAVQRHGAHLAIWGVGDVQLFRKYAKFAPKLVTLTAFISISKDTGCLGDPRWRWSSVSYCGLSHVACSAALLVTSVKEILSRRLMIMVAQYIWYHNTVRCSWSWQPVMLI